MELRYLEIFCKVVELKSFSKAAAALFLTQPTVSSHIRSLEEEVGIRLLDRLGKNVLPTRAGEILYKHSRDILAIKGNLIQAITEFKGNVRGNLIIGGSTIPGEYILPAFIGAFRKGHPDIKIMLKIGDSQDIINMLLDGSIEAGIIGSRPEDKRISHTEFLSDEVVMISSVHNAHILQDGIMTMDILKTLPLIIREKGSGSRKALEDCLKKHGLTIEDMNIAAEMGSTEAIKQAVKADVGVSFISRCAIKDEILGNHLREIRLDALCVSRNFHIVTNRMRAVSPLCQTFIRELTNANQAQIFSIEEPVRI